MIDRLEYDDVNELLCEYQSSIPVNNDIQDVSNSAACNIGVKEQDVSINFFIRLFMIVTQMNEVIYDL